MKSMITIIKEQVNAFYLIIRLSLFELKSKNNNNYLGMLWELINPLIQIGIYWFVFGIGIRGGSPVNGIPYVYWMLSGIVVWFFVNPAILEASKAIYTRINFIAKMSFPMSVIPTYVIVSKFYPHILLTALIAIALQFGGFFVSIYYLQLFYFMFACLALLIALSLITSTLATIVRDVQMIVQAVVRMLLYLTPLLWTPQESSKLPEFIQMVMMANPLYYIVEGYRAALLGTSWFMVENIGYTIYFWALVIVLLGIGSFLHLKFRNHFVDYL
ncbi:ABC transporter permease [Bacillus sp. 7894-2]|uniref:ABC transporter permease n=1 Tax=Bacillus sp. 7894-2 TaxID=2021695 RepID=UPI000BA62106|nr:ABC transporter permease [Bacillus sp. 7894-2]PAE25813.1 teichoic acid ABC transporter permease [Bacillus sp. 7894-2]